MHRNVVRVLCVIAALAVDTVVYAAVPAVATIPEIEDGVTIIENETVGGGFGWCVRPLGDINGDGREDVAFLAQGWGTAPENVSYVLYGREMWPRRLELSRVEEWGTRIHSTPDRRHSLPYGGVGDLDGDGITDIAFNVCYGPETCPPLILFGGQNLPPDVTTDELATFRVCELYPDRSLETGMPAPGFTVFAGGDLDGDGVNDLVCGGGNLNRPGEPQGEGIVYVVRGIRPFPGSIDFAEVGTLVAGTRLTAFSSRGPVKGISPRFGMRAACGKDFDRDGFQDLAIAAPSWPIATDENEFAGAVFVVFGRSAWPASLDVAADGATRVCRLFSRTADQYLGEETLAAIEDVTGDAVPDLLVSGGSSCYLISGADLVSGDFLIDEIATTCFSYASSGAPVGTSLIDWSGDGMNRLAFGSRNAYSNAGAACIVAGRTSYPYPSPLEGPLDGLTRIVGHLAGAHLGASMAGCDLNGDGRSELVAGSVGGSLFPFLPIQPDPADPPGRLYVVSGALDFLGPLEARSFTPSASNLAGGMLLTVTGRGFDAQTAVFLGDTALEIVERPDSRSIVARIPPSAVEVSLPVKVTRGAQTVVVQGEFTYFRSVFPYELDVKNFGAHGVGILCSEFWPITEETRQIEDRNVSGSGDFTGDGRADVLFAYMSHRNQRSQIPRPGRVFLLHGAEDSPQTLTTATIAPYATIFTSTDPEDFFGDSAALVGDMNGEGACDLAIAAPLAGRVYVLFGGEIPKGEVVVQTLIEAGRGFVVEGCPTIPWLVNRTEPGVRITLLRDLNGDGLSDFGLVTERVPGFDTADPGEKGSLVIVMGSRLPVAAIAYDSLPKIEPPVPAWGGEDTYFVYAHGVGDVDGDTFDDLYLDWVASQGTSVIRRQAVFFGRRAIGGVMTVDGELAAGNAIELSFTPSSWGRQVAGVGDQNGDGRDDLAVICSLAGPGCCTPHSDPPRFWLRILNGRSRQELAASLDVSSTADFDATFSQADDSQQILAVGDGGRDLDADGRPDLLLLQHRYYDKGLPDRAIALFGGELAGKAGMLNEVRDSYQLLDYRPFVGPGFYGFEFENYHFAGDVNGDGYEDTVVRTPVTLWIYMNPLGALKYGRPFVRGDANQDGKIDIADAISTLTFLFAHGRVLPCMDAGDANDDEQLNIADAIRTLSFLFGSGVKPPLPPPNECGNDPQGDTLDCRESSCP